MIDVSRLKMGDSVFWLDEENCVLEHTYIGNIGRIGILSGELTEIGYNKNGYPTGQFPLINKNIKSRIDEIIEDNEPYNPYPVCFVSIENLYESKIEAEGVMLEL